MRKFVLIFAIILTFFGCSKKEQPKEIAASIYPLVWTVKQVYPSYEVYQIIKPGVNPHLYDLTPQDALHIERAVKVFLIGNLEPFAPKIAPNKRVEVVELLNLPKSSNPHYWLSPKRWLKFVEKLNKVQGLNLDLQKWQKVVNRLKELDKLYEQKLSAIKDRVEIIMVHPAFYWTCKDYHLHVLAILEPKGGLGISPKTLIELKGIINQIKDKKILVLIASINPHAREVAKTLEEISPKVKVVALDPIVSHTQGDYVKIMEDNLNKILTASR